MTMSSSELQSYVTAGYVPHTSGVSEIDTPITFNGSVQVKFEPNRFVWTGSSSRSIFEYDFIGSGTSQAMFFDSVEVVSEIDGSPIFRTVDSGATPHNLCFDNCEFTVLGAYAIDLNECGYTVVPIFRNMRTNGSGALRMRGSTGADYWWATSQCIIHGWTHTGSNRVGPAWNLRGPAGLEMKACVDQGAMGLHADLVTAGWEGPLTLQIQSPRSPIKIINLFVDWDDTNDDDAPNCFIGEIRTNNPDGTGQHEIAELWNPTLVHDAIDASVKPWMFMGSNNSAHHSLIIDLVNAESPDLSKLLLGGRMALRVTRPWYKPGESSTGDTLETEVNSIFPDAFQDRIETSTTKMPSPDETAATTYSGSSYETAYVAETQQYDELLEG